ncbi:MAG: hypothetical protein ACO1Q7_06165 [Gemmatimonas sp.]
MHAACAHAGVTGVHMSVDSDFPVGAGLGGSSAAGVAVAGALARWKNASCALADLAETSRFVETNGLRVAGGFQDHYAAAFGGALALTFQSRNSVRQLALDHATVRALETQCLLVYTGESRISGETITAVLEAYNDRTSHVVQSLEKMKSLAMSMADSIERGDVDALGALVGEHWTHQRSLHQRISTSRIDAIEEQAYKAGALGLKALGASGGGCVVVFAPTHAVDAVASAVAPFGERLAWKVAHTGVEIREEPLSSDDVTG